MIPKRILLVVVPDELADKTIKTIMRVNHTGKSGDGKIFVTTCQESIRVRTGESGDTILDDI